MNSEFCLNVCVFVYYLQGDAFPELKESYGKVKLPVTKFESYSTRLDTVRFRLLMIRFPL